MADNNYGVRLAAAIDNHLTSDCKVAELIASYNDRKEAVKK